MRHSPRFLRRTALALVLLSPFAAGFAASDPLADGFRSPPADARPHTWWHWMNGNVTKEGITADLEAMARIGVGGAQIFNVAQGELVGPVKVLSPEWFALTKHAMAEAQRLGLEMTMHNCPGWSESGGPWIKPEQAMQQVTWSEVHVQGPTRYSGELPQPRTVQGFYRDIAVLALPAGPGDERDFYALAPKITTSLPGGAGGASLAGRNSPGLSFPVPTAGQPRWVQYEFAAPQTFSSVRVQSPQQRELVLDGAIEVSDDGATWRKVTGQTPWLRNRNVLWQSVSFDAATARFFRFVVAKVDNRARTLSLGAVEFGGARLGSLEERAGYKPNPEAKFSPAGAAPGVAAASVVDLTARVKDGRLEWEVPAGHWSILRFGHTLTGQTNAPAAETARGLECDKMNRAAVETNFAGMMGAVIKEVGPLAGKSFKLVLADSWEAGCQNWTPAMRAEFQKRRGYDPLKWLPALAGRIVGSAQESERFLWDFRRTIGDLIAENHYAVFRELCHKHGMLFTAEAPGIGMPTIADELECKGRTDVPMGEFWMDGHNDSKETATSAHVYGAKIAAAESFTARTDDAKWMKSPFDHKMLGDLHFALGINRYVFHRYAHQPWLDRLPGMTMGPWGTNFERTNTWWEPARAWMQYIARCQFLLQRGLFVADVCYLYGENIPNTLVRREPALPAGYDYDAINAEVLLQRLSVKDGRLTLPDGVNYRVLLLPDSAVMTPAVARKIKELVAAGATVVGRRPERSPSLADYPRCDDEVKKIAAEVWGDCDGAKVTEHAFGRGKAFWGRPVGDVLAALGAGPDFVAQDTTGKFAFLHRYMDGADVYFVSSQSAAAMTATLAFRSSGRVPELWRADTGQMVRAARFSERDGRTLVPLDFDPAGSVFVVFRSPDRGIDAVASMTRDGAPATLANGLTLTDNGRVALAAAAAGKYELKSAAGKTLRASVTALPPAIDLSGGWTVKFPAGWGAPAEYPLPQLASWTQQPDDGVKYFSGTATYVKEFDLTAEALGAGKELWLDLGRVKEIAEVKLNGRDLGVLWKPPFQVDITSAAHAGKNSLEVRVTNLWPNRLIGDQRLPEKERRTWASFNPFKADSPLLESGLLGPVEVSARARVVFE